jgi:hypothetical protein
LSRWWGASASRSWRSRFEVGRVCPQPAVLGEGLAQRRGEDTRVLPTPTTWEWCDHRWGALRCGELLTT